MNLNQKLSKLFNEVGGDVHIGRSLLGLISHGYIHLVQDDKEWFVSHSTHRTGHIVTRGGPNPFGVKFSKSDNTAKAAFILTSSKQLQGEQSEWWKTEVDSTVDGLSKLMKDHIDKAYSYHFSS